MSKKADISVNTIVMAALALIVLVILLFIFKEQIGNIAGGFFTAGNNAKNSTSGVNCRDMFSSRACGSETSFWGVKYEQGSLVPPPCNPKGGVCQNKWNDCPDNCYEVGQAIIKK